MDSVNIRELRNRGGQVIDRVTRGASIVVTKGGTPVAELRPFGRPTLGRETLLARWKRLQPVDPAALRRDPDRVLDPSL